MNARIKTIAATLTLLASIASGAPAESQVRVKDIATLEGERTNTLTGLGLVTGLNGTGGNTPDTRTLSANLVQRLGNRINPLLRNALGNDTQRKTDNVSVVLVTAELPVGARPGQRLDAVVAAMDDASSLRGGILAMTPLIGADENVYATASGMISTNSISASGNGATVTKNHPTVARLPSGAVVEREVAVACSEPKSIRLLLHTPDWDTVGRVTDAINQVAPDTAIPENAGVVFVETPTGLKERADFIRLVTNLKVTPDISARVVINERSGTVTIGSNVKLSLVAISHGNLSVITGETPLVSQPMPLSDGETTVVQRTDIDVVEERNPITVINETFTVGDLAGALNALGVSPTDLSAIFQQLKAAGALHAAIEFQ